MPLEKQMKELQIAKKNYKRDVKKCYEYRQKELKYVDPTGDYALYHRTYNIFKNLFGLLIGNEMDINTDILEDLELDDPFADQEYPHPVDNDLEFTINEVNARTDIDDHQKRRLVVFLKNRQLSIQGRDNPFNREGFKKMMTQVLVDELQNGIVPKYGTPHRWSDAVYEDEKFGLDVVFKFEKILVALAGGLTWIYMTTGQERPLIEWMLVKPKGSLMLHDIFRKSYQLNKGDVYLTLLTIENVLAKNFLIPNREKLPVTQRLRSYVSGWNYNCDLFGSWYHLFGMMLYGYVTGEFSSSMIGRIEALGSNVLSRWGINQTQKQWANKKGGSFGKDLADIVRKKEWKGFVSDPVMNLSPSTYLDMSEDFRDRLYIPNDPGFELRIINHENEMSEIDYLVLKSKEKTLLGCTVEAMIVNDSGGTIYSGEKEVFKNIDLKKNRSTYLPYMPGFGDEHIGKRSRIFISNCSNDPRSYSFEKF